MSDPMRMLVHADNLSVLREMDSETIDLIVTDPPFNTGRDFAKFDDRWSWTKGVEDAWIKKLRSVCPVAWDVICATRSVHSDSMGAFVCFMGIRLLEMRRVLKSTGSLYLHCDPTASHYLKLLLDAIFGRAQFRNEIVWCYGGRGMARRWFQRKHDILLFYSKKDRYMFNTTGASRPVAPEHVGRYNKTDSTGRRYARIKNRNGKYSHVYLKDVVLEDWWKIPYVRGNETVGYPTQKPIALLTRIIASSSNPGDVVLDPFCGSGTTLVAAERLDRQWIGIDTSDDAVQLARERVETEQQRPKQLAL